MPPAALAVAEARKLCFALGVGVAIYAIDNVRLKGLGALALIGRAGYGLYAIHAPGVDFAGACSRRRYREAGPHRIEEMRIEEIV